MATVPQKRAALWSVTYPHNGYAACTDCAVKARNEGARIQLLSSTSEWLPCYPCAHNASKSSVK